MYFCKLMLVNLNCSILMEQLLKLGGATGLQPTLNGKPTLASRLFPCTAGQQMHEVKIGISVVSACDNKSPY